MPLFGRAANARLERELLTHQRTSTAPMPFYLFRKNCIHGWKTVRCMLSLNCSAYSSKPVTLDMHLKHQEEKRSRGLAMAGISEQNNATLYSQADALTLSSISSDVLKYSGNCPLEAKRKCNSIKSEATLVSCFFSFLLL